jgi:hypothetical protein
MQASIHRTTIKSTNTTMGDSLVTTTAASQLTLRFVLCCFVLIKKRPLIRRPGNLNASPLALALTVLPPAMAGNPAMLSRMLGKVCSLTALVPAMSGCTCALSEVRPKMGVQTMATRFTRLLYTRANGLTRHPQHFDDNSWVAPAAATSLLSLKNEPIFLRMSMEPRQSDQGNFWQGL